ncbi:MAG: protease modulator HflC [Bdellovibrionales bacterium]
MSARTMALVIILGVLAVVVSQTLFIVRQGEQALVLQFGEWKRTVNEPGLHARTPFIQNLLVFEKRVLDIEPPGQQVTLGDKTRLEVDTYARYRITDPLRFYQALQNEGAARIRLANIVNSVLSEVLAKYTLSDLLSVKRGEVMYELRSRVREQADGTGVEIVDVRIRRADLPEETSQPIFARMISERQREAAQARAEGQETAASIRSEADKERTTLLSEAKRDADIIRGEGEKIALDTLAAATGRDPGFYAFYRSLEAYRNSLGKDSTTMVISPDSDFFKYFEKGPGR